ncbi:amino acid adenylation domain-containing protein [Rheinheimera sp. WS51]|uniref:non-ribosomal peptide synthetase n=1 Tax=Rheinheimera sp. WS51 TaxID=3425886 RepID=UPI003D91F4E6
MNIEYLIGKAEKHDIELFLDNGKLGYRAYKAQPSKGLLQELSENKVAILQYLQQQAVSTADYSQPIPVSTSQQRIWTIDQLEQGSTEFHIPTVFLRSSSTDLLVLIERLKSIVEQHYVLRCNFMEKDGELYQQVESVNKLKITQEDLSHLEYQDAITQAKVHIEEDNQLAFNLADDLPLRAIFFRLPQQHAIIYINIHHIAVDENSVNLLLNQLFSEESAEKSNSLSYQYADYVYWQQAHLRSYPFKQKLAAYAEQLTGAPALHSLTLDFPYSTQTTNAAAQHKIKLNPVLTLAAFKLCHQQQITPFMLLQGALSAFLSVWTRCDDIVLGTPSILRPQDKFEQVIGCFLNLSVLRSQFNEGMTALDVIKQAKKVSLNLLDWQSIPFETLLEKLKPERSPLYSPLFQILFSMHMLEQPKNGSENNSISAIGVNRFTTKYDLTVHANVRKQHIEFNFDYKTDLFSASSIAQLANAFNLFLDTFIQAPATEITKINLVSTNDAVKISQFNATQIDYPRQKRIDQLISQQAKATPNKIAIEAEQCLTYHELEQYSQRIAQALALQGVRSGEHIGIMLERSALMVCTMLALMKLEAAYVPLDPAYPAQRLQYIFQSAQCSILISDIPGASSIVGATTCISPETLLHNASPLTLPNSVLGSEAPAYLIFTSGSTGLPKGIAIQHHNVVNLLVSMQKKPGITNQDKLLAITPISFDISVLELFLPLISGACLVIASQDARDGFSLRQRLEQGDINLMQATPAGWQSLIDAGWQGNTQLTALCGGEILSAQLANELCRRTASLWNMYGPTETTVWSSVAEVNATDHKNITIGQPIANTGIYIVSTKLQQCALNQTGEIAITGEGVCLGYVSRPELTQSRFVNLKTADGEKRAYLTGDLGRMTIEGKLHCLGRTDDQVKLRGFRIELTEIDAVMLLQPNIKQAATVIHQHNNGATLVCYYCPEQQDIANNEQLLLQQLKQKLPNYMVPDRIVRMSQFPLTPSGKVDRKALSTLTLEQQQTQQFPPETELQRELVTLWQQLTGETEIGITDNFFAIGGDSISSVKVVRFLRDHGYDMNNKLLFSHQTIQELTAHLPPLIATNTSKISEIQVDGIDMLLSADDDDSDLAAILKEFSTH